MSPHVRTVKTAPGTAAAQIVYSSRRGARNIERVRSAHDDAEVEVLTAAARQRMAAGQGEVDLGLDRAAPATPAGGPLPITSSRMGHLWEALTHAYRVLGFEQATDADEVFRQLVLARIIEPTSKLDSLRVLDEAGVSPASISAGSAIQGDGPAPPAACGRGLLARRGDGRSERRHLPMT